MIEAEVAAGTDGAGAGLLQAVTRLKAAPPSQNLACLTD